MSASQTREHPVSRRLRQAGGLCPQDGERVTSNENASFPLDEPFLPQ